MKKEKNKKKANKVKYSGSDTSKNEDMIFEIKEVAINENTQKKEKTDKPKKKSWEYLNEVKEYIYNLIIESPEYLDEEVAVPKLIYPNLVRYEVSDPVNNFILSMKTIEKKYPNNLWVTAETMKKCYFTDYEGNRKPVFILKKGSKAIKIGIRKFEKSVRDDVTGKYYKLKLDNPYTENVNVYNISQFKFAKNIYPKSREEENKNKEELILNDDLICKLSEQKLENKIEKFFIKQRYKIQNENFISNINKKELLEELKNKKSKKGTPYSNVFIIEYCSVKAKIYMGLDLRKSEEELIK